MEVSVEAVWRSLEAWSLEEMVSVEAVWRSLEAIICALDDVKESDDKEAKLRASAFLNDIVNIDFVCGLMFLKNIMPQTKTLSDYLQRKSVNVGSALVVLN